MVTARIYVRSFQTGAGKQLISVDGGREPAWSQSGRELFYRRGREILTVPIGDGPGFSAGSPVVPFSVVATMTDGPTGERDWDVSPDGTRFLFMRSPRAVSPFSVRILMNFPAAVAQSAR